MISNRWQAGEFRVTLMTLVILVALVVLASPLLAEQRVGMIIGARGEVTLREGGEDAPARLMGLLREGMQISVSEGAEVTVVLFAEGRRMRLAEQSIVEVEASGLASLAGPAPTALAPLPDEALEVLRDQALDERPGRGAGVVFRGAGKQKRRLELVSPVETRIAERKPIFRWSSDPGIDHYRLTVSNLEGETLWEDRTEESEIRYPDEAPELEPGEFYFWDVRAFSDDSRPAVAGADFTLLDEAELGALQRSREHLEAMAEGSGDDPTSRIALAVLCRDLELFDDAEEILRSLGEQYPEETLVREALEDLYEQRGKELPPKLKPTSGEE